MLRADLDDVHMLRQEDLSLVIISLTAKGRGGGGGAGLQTLSTGPENS
jgi:hypothetical protein